MAICRRDNRQVSRRSPPGRLRIPARRREIELAPYTALQIFESGGRRVETILKAGRDFFGNFVPRAACIQVAYCHINLGISGLKLL